VAQESLKLESGLILLAIAVSGAPFWDCSARSGRDEHVRAYRQQGSATMAAMAAGCFGGIDYDGGGLLVAIPSMLATIGWYITCVFYGRTGQFRAGNRVENGNRVFGRLVFERGIGN